MPHAPQVTVVSVPTIAPYDLTLSLRVASSFAPEPLPDFTSLRSAVRIKGKPTLLQLRQVSAFPPVLEAQAPLPDSASEIKQIAGRITFADLDLRPFYRLVASDPIFGPMTKDLHGLKPMRPASLFEMLVIAITEQQISLAAAYHIRMRIMERFGDPVKDLRAFPTPKRLAECSIEDLRGCGLSRRKAEYVQEAACNVNNGTLDLERLETMSDEDVRSLLLRQRGIGPWSSDYVLVRGLNRPDCVPADDLGLRGAVGRYLGRGGRLSPAGVMRKLSPFKPYRGLAAFYLLAHGRPEKTHARMRS